MPQVDGEGRRDRRKRENRARIYDAARRLFLAQGFDARAHRRLVNTNWIRTVAWSLRALLASWMLLRVAAAGTT